ncbi:MAG: agmatinase family protein [Desulfovibrio sp.]|jgi:agmatinase|nr:agmatinase family protein [Desulfovibrio sp.]
MEQAHFLDSEYPQAPPERAAFHIIPVPLERSVSYGGGAANGPAALLLASRQLEAAENGIAPGESGFYTAPFVSCEGGAEAVLARVESTVARAVDCRACPVLLGGEHTVSLGALRALARGGEIGIVQIDAHADLRPEYGGDPFSHACVMYRAVNDLKLPLVQFAVREISREEEALRRRLQICHYDAAALARDGLPPEPLPRDFPRRLYISFDLDGLDASLMPATGTPSPGGLFWHDAVELLRRCALGREIAGFDVVELAPVPSLRHADFTAAKLAHVLMTLALPPAA